MSVVQPPRPPSLARHPHRPEPARRADRRHRDPDQRAQQVRARQEARRLPARPGAPQRGPLPGRLRVPPPHARRGRRSAGRPGADDDPGLHRLPGGRAADRPLPPGGPRSRGREGAGRAAGRPLLRRAQRPGRHPVALPQGDRALLSGVQGSGRDADRDAGLRGSGGGAGGDREGDGGVRTKFTGEHG